MIADANDDMPDRLRIPNRRTGITETIMVGQAVYDLTLTIDLRDGKPWPEMFLTGAKGGSAMEFVLHDAATIISIALQCGVPLQVLADSVSRVPREFGSEAVDPGSVIGAALDALIAAHALDYLQPKAGNGKA
jgi:ribonucleoside-diphosphate reductase alpha chain